MTLAVGPTIRVLAAQHPPIREIVWYTRTARTTAQLVAPHTTGHSER